ncbi:hypothetical protein CWR48_03185 [Oceanobacillus arenosus]|uniref:HTH araC/xylS-type domain-containing protein n=1 Tax=Oceanobacillus arenosus TaxID=1229153 RepID=A0A3D8PZ13_9BACI|nr:AraC family transcriptional regulator [Oceanobacillus arenosus]RDW21420.1 hypothetical protein CWR48_03185 [Oceanobacillus arenosus]
MEVNSSSMNQRIERDHQIREAFLQAILTCDTNEIDYYKQEILKVLKNDTLNIFKRVPGNMLRSYKNFLLSHNTLYSYSAEKGGLSAAKSHFISEKYAIMIEHTDQISKLDMIHLNMIDEYGDPSIRYDKITNPSIADKAIHYIETNFAEEFLIEEMAHDLHVHPSHLMRSFKKEKGTTISHWRNQKRIKEAKGLLIHSNLSMTDIAIMVGFNNSQYFSKIFKKEEGVTPKAFRKAHSNSLEE